MNERIGIAVVTVAALALAAPPPVTADGNASGTAQIEGGGSWSDAYNKNVPELTDVATKEFVDPLGKEFVKSCADNAEALESTAKKVAEKVNAPGSSGMTDAMRQKGRDLLKESKQASGWWRTMGNWADKGLTFLKMVDFVSTTAQAAGYLAEGDKTGAVNVVVNDVSKKTCAAAGSFGLSWIPVVGPAGGAAAGEELHNTYVKPVLDKRADELRIKEAKEKQLGKPWLPPNLIIDRNGTVRELPPDMYADANTRNIVRRTPEEQQRYEDSERIDWLDGKKLEGLQQDALEGKIPPDQYGKLMADFKHRDRTKPWEPPGFEAGSGEPDPVDQENDGEDDGDQQADEGQVREEPAKPDDKIFEFVSPQVVTAVGQTQEDYSHQEFKNIATTNFTLTFWNVGGMAQGYGAASLSAVTTFTMHPAVEKATCGGFFSGGPNGTFVLSCDGDSMNLTMSYGQTIRGGGAALTVQNPGAFAGWPKEFK